jgi:hypothetical protein
MASNEQYRKEKLDAKFTGVIHKVKDGTIVPDDQWVVFLAKDTVFSEMFRDPHSGYVARLKEHNADAEQIAAAIRMETRLIMWRRYNSHMLKIPDAKGEKLLDQK